MAIISLQENCRPTDLLNKIIVKSYPHRVTNPKFYSSCSVIPVIINLFLVKASLKFCWNLQHAWLPRGSQARNDHLFAISLSSLVGVHLDVKVHCGFPGNRYACFAKSVFLSVCFFFSFLKFYYCILYNVYLCTCFPEWLHSKTKSLNTTSNPSIGDNAPSFCKKMPSLWFSGCLTVGCSQNMGCNLPQWAWWCILQWPVVLYWLVRWVSKEGINNWRPFLKVKSNFKWKASDVQIQFMILKEREQKWWHHKNQLCEI